MKLAIVDDDAGDAAHASRMLREAGHAIESFSSIEEFKRHVRRDTFDLAVLDWNMPEMSGIELLTWIREVGAPELPVIIVTARTETQDVTMALDAGADDYVTKPLAGPILLSRIKAVARRTVAKPKVNDILCVKDIVLHAASGKARLAADEILLTAKEFELAAILLTNLGRALSRRYLLETIWGANPNVFTRTVDAHISKVRTKLCLRPEWGFALRTIYGYGYRLESIEEEPVLVSCVTS
ncbi:response regulator transcription factor [Sphingomonas cavernae]|uniref:DNA-binding response regulator n=1 Tax=Sphingomonas cavernae TaxID=2320861 RepID=A0A418WJK0_9SPHN|nr:response regulator transcription factor [Sphingomonas cavernae]RJF90231.1 DNA-binding response regulator [Sphingomonas cavernae]